jgi:hypothetical protein
MSPIPFPHPLLYLSRLRLGIDDIIRTISTYFVVFLETPNAKCTRNLAKCTCKISTIPSIPSLSHDPLQIDPTSTCNTCPQFAVHSHRRPAQGPNTWHCDWCERGQKHDLTRLHVVEWTPCLKLHDTISDIPSGPTTLTAFNSGFVPNTTPILLDP